MSIYCGKHIIAVGPNKLFNELLSNFIAKEIGAVCTTAITLSSVSVLTDRTAGKRLIIYDFRKEHSLNSLSSVERNIMQDNYVVLANVSSDLQIEREALQCGVRGFLYPENGITTILKMVESIFKSELWIPRLLMNKLLLERTLYNSQKQHKEDLVLTVQQLKILNALAQGLTNDAIADTFGISPHTVKTHIYHIFKKIKVTNRLQAALWAANHCN